LILTVILFIVVHRSNAEPLELFRRPGSIVVWKVFVPFVDELLLSMLMVSKIVKFVGFVDRLLARCVTRETVKGRKDIIVTLFFPVEVEDRTREYLSRFEYNVSRLAPIDMAVIP
jgi:hypothetical protein